MCMIGLQGSVVINYRSPCKPDKANKKDKNQITIQVNAISDIKDEIILDGSGDFDCGTIVSFAYAGRLMKDSDS